VKVIIRVVVGSTDVSVDISISVIVVTSSCSVLVGATFMSGLCVVLVGTAAGTKVVDVELSIATDGIACALVLGKLVGSSEMGGTGLTVFSGWEVLSVVGMTTGMLVSDVTADPAPPPAVAGKLEAGMIAAEDGCVLCAVVVVDGLDVETTAVEGALYVFIVVDGSRTDGTIVIGTAGTLCAVTVGPTFVGGIAGTEALCDVPAAADAAVKKPDVPGTAGADE
jgi:hypothetical protein